MGLDESQHTIIKDRVSDVGCWVVAPPPARLPIHMAPMPSIPSHSMPSRPMLAMNAQLLSNNQQRFGLVWFESAKLKQFKTAPLKKIET